MLTDQWLLENGADMEVQGEYALQAASGHGDLETVRILVEMGAAVNAVGRCHETALQQAASGGHLAVVKLLVENQADIKVEGGEYGAYFLRRELIN